MSNAFKKFYSTSMDFRQALSREVSLLSIPDNSNQRNIAAFIFADISAEHGHAVHLLASGNCYISASSLLRLQFESLVKAQWIYWIAKDSIVERLYKPLTQQHANQAERYIPTVNIILKDLKESSETGGIQPKAI